MSTDRDYIDLRALAVLDTADDVWDVRNTAWTEWDRADEPLLTERARRVLAAVEHALAYCPQCSQRGLHMCEHGEAGYGCIGKDVLAPIRRAWMEKETP